MSALLILPSCAQTAKPRFEIKTRTLGHAPDGSPDSRRDVGIGERVEIKVVPETIGYVEWVIQGDAVESNRFGNPAIVFMGGSPGAVSFSVCVHDAPRAAPPSFKKIPAMEKWRRLEAQLMEIEKLAGQPSAFESHCDKICADVLLHEGLEAAARESLARFSLLLEEISDLSRRAPGSSSWAEIQSQLLEASALRLGACLDSTAEKSALEDDFWKLLHACTVTLDCQYKQFEVARRNARKRIKNDSPPAVLVGTDGNGVVLPKGPAAVASAFGNSLPDLRYLLYVQVLNALPGTTRGQQKEALGGHGFSKDEAELLLNPLECFFKQ